MKKLIKDVSTAVALTCYTGQLEPSKNCAFEIIFVVQTSEIICSPLKQVKIHHVLTL
jgi:hypothetical protein